MAYQNMLFAVRKQLQTNKMPVKLYNLVEAVIKLHIDDGIKELIRSRVCLLYTSPSPRDKRQSRMPSSA